VGKNTVYLSLGSNLGDRAATLLEALRRIRQLGAVVAVSSVYETEPVEVPAEDVQPWYLNCAAAIESGLTPEQFLAATQAVELALGRERVVRHAPRTLDIDILLFGEAVVRTSELTIPHPGLARRRFVLQPLVEIAPDVRHPILKKTVREMLAALPPQAGVRRLEHGLNWAQ
jgi:2-amino-4-hydroxy-6-hydroxymethyldihydropteridine diphosphokinase